MKFKAICPKTGKIETIYCESINCSTMDNPNNFILGLMYACSVDLSGRNLCSDCPIYQTLAQLSDVNKL